MDFVILQVHVVTDVWVSTVKSVEETMKRPLYDEQFLCTQVPHDVKEFCLEALDRCGVAFGASHLEVVRCAKSSNALFPQSCPVQSFLLIHRMISAIRSYVELSWNNFVVHYGSSSISFLQININIIIRSHTIDRVECAAGWGSAKSA